MQLIKNFRLRVTYVKHGRLCNLSHLEITSALERAIRRAKLPFAVTQGFSPHMKLSFGSALPVGVGSDCEIFDVTLKDYVKAQVALEKLQEKSVCDLMPLGATYIELKAASASNTFTYSKYVASYAGLIPDFEVPEQIEVKRKYKTKILNVDDYLVEMPVIDNKQIECVLKSTQAGTLRIDKLLESFNLGVTPLSVTRVEQF